MTDFDAPASYGDSWADIYDQMTAVLDPAPAVRFLADLAENGRVLELGIGTGRVALPLVAQGITVEGLDASSAMVDKLRAKPGGDAIPVTISDMAEVAVSGSFRLVYLVYNTLFSLLSQARQAECFRNAAQVLALGGMFVIECFVPDPAHYDNGQRIQILDMTEDSASLELTWHEAVAQRLYTKVLTLSKDGVDMRPITVRYSWPSELDLMADQAGLSLRERFASWDRQPFDGASPGHISVYQRRTT